MTNEQETNFIFEDYWKNPNVRKAGMTREGIARAAFNYFKSIDGNKWALFTNKIIELKNENKLLKEAITRHKSIKIGDKVYHTSWQTHENFQETQKYYAKKTKKPDELIDLNETSSNK